MLQQNFVYGLEMSAPVAVLIAVLVTLAAGLATQLGTGVPNDPPDRNENLAQADENLPDDKPEQKRNSNQSDVVVPRKVSKKRDNVCVGKCADVWQRYELTPWPIYEQP